MNTDNFIRFQETMKAKGYQAALLSNPATLTWLTGYAPPIQTGPNPFEGGPALGWWQDQQLTIVASDAEAGAFPGNDHLQIIDYVSYTIDEPMVAAERQAVALQTTLTPAQTLKGKVGVELNFLPARMATIFHQLVPGVITEPLDGAFDKLRAIKSKEEIAKIQASLKLCDQAQRFVSKQARAGMSEIELWGALKTDLEITVGSRLPILADLVVGLRTAEIGGLPGESILQTGDPIIADIVPRLNGYWGDNAGTHFVGEPSAELQKMYTIVRNTLRKGVEAIKPGVLAGDLDTMLRAEIASQGYPVYPHHSGHGIGATFHEEPRLVPGNNLPLALGMIVALEPGIYLPDVGGVRLEDVVLVTADGSELLTTHLL